MNNTTRILAMILLASFGGAACGAQGPANLDEPSATGSKKNTNTNDDDDGDKPVAKSTSSNPPPKSEASQPSTPTTTTPQLSLLTPATANTGTTSLTLTVAGSGFASNAMVKFNGQVVASQIVSANSMSATITSAQLAQVGTFPVVVSSGGVDSNPINFTVVNAITPVRLTSLSPARMAQFSTATTVAVNGGGFANGAKVSFNGTELSTTFGSAGLLTATIPETSLRTAGSFSITVNSDGQLSAPLTFTVDPRTSPTLTSVNITGLFAGAGSTAVDVRGTGFDGTTRVAVYSPALTTGEALTPTTVTGSTTVTVTIPAKHFSIAGEVTVRAYNLLPNGQGLYATGSKTITVTPSG